MCFSLRVMKVNATYKHLTFSQPNANTDNTNMITMLTPDIAESLNARH
jgi:hypothetical protein